MMHTPMQCDHGQRHGRPIHLFGGRETKDVTGVVLIIECNPGLDPLPPSQKRQKKGRRDEEVVAAHCCCTPRPHIGSLGTKQTNKQTNRITDWRTRLA